jgi:tRNA pseudouridine38-40 synthase
MPTFKVVLEYDGTDYAGWQRQANAPTVQAAVEEALSGIAQTPIAIVGAGRTDAGVHALGQVASFRSDRRLTARDWLRALNAHLPSDIAAVEVEATSDDFHARYSATAKLYRYRILNRPERSPLLRHRAWSIFKPLDIAAVQEAATALVGRHDFSAFECMPTANTNAVCDVRSLAVERDGDLVDLTIYADRFLKQMVRSIVGTLVEIGQGKRSPTDLKRVLESGDRSQAGRTAPPQGLYLVRVDYAGQKDLSIDDVTD